VQEVELDCVILGGGIAGLWTLLRLRQAGYQALLLETRALGAGQSIAAQGIIHGGVKYALLGGLTDSSEAVAGMPERWRRCLAGDGELDLRGVRVNAEHQLLWTTGDLASGLAGFFAGKLLRGRMQPIPRALLPPPFQHPDFRGSLYRLAEPVLDVPSLLARLAELGAPWIRRCDGFRLLPDGQPLIELAGGQRLRPRRLLLAAGAGNAELLRQLGRSGPAMQRRPLRMLMLRGELPPLYAHCLGASANPRLTITTHRDSRDRTVWYLGGDLAEQGAGLTEAELIERARAELAELLPWVAQEGLQFASIPLDRAEVSTPGGRRPDDCFVDDSPPLMTVWPTKLVFAPRVADLVLAALQRGGLEPGPAIDPDRLGRLAQPDVAEPPWEAAAWS